MCMCEDVNVRDQDASMLTVEVTTALGTITVRFFFHFSHQTGLVLLAIRPS